MKIELFLISFITGSGLLIAVVCHIVNHSRSQDRTLAGKLYRPRTPRSGGPGTGKGTGDRTRYRPS